MELRPGDEPCRSRAFIGGHHAPWSRLHGRSPAPRLAQVGMPVALDGGGAPPARLNAARTGVSSVHTVARRRIDGPPSRGGPSAITYGSLGRLGLICAIWHLA